MMVCLNRIGLDCYAEKDVFSTNLLCVPSCSTFETFVVSIFNHKEHQEFSQREPGKSSRKFIKKLNFIFTQSNIAK
jgi:hypothetical protein